MGTGSFLPTSMGVGAGLNSVFQALHHPLSPSVPSHQGSPLQPPFFFFIHLSWFSLETGALRHLGS